YVDPELEVEPELELEPELEAVPEVAAEPELQAELEPEPEFDVGSEGDFTDTSSTLLDQEDALDEFNDENLESIDDLLSELEQPTDDYVETPDWSVDGVDDELKAESELEVEAEPEIEAEPEL
ncbi:hypothetical protein, partial [Pseudoalteromonas sp. S3173]|uniref:hypothetical protein n=1 Tax=Pseudoalteromonas sp. S3173 TaxID=579531 RepID=UPI00110D24A2